MKEKRWLYCALGLTAIGFGAPLTTAAQSVYPMRFDDVEAVSEATVSADPVDSAGGSGASALTVVGEVLTVDSSGEPRMWGRGRPGTAVYGSVATGRLCTNGSVQFGLSQHAVDWGSAADACPAGFWVCTGSDRGTVDCDTLRQDSSIDGIGCAGESLDWPSNDHSGWIADGAASGMNGVRAQEQLFLGLFLSQTCNSFPVWCCTQ